MSVLRLALIGLALIGSWLPIHADDDDETKSLLVQNDWRLKFPATCQQASCCCFTDSVNIYESDDEGLSANGTVAGALCDNLVEEDNLFVTAYSWSQEFLGINFFTFTLANDTYQSTPGWSLTAIASGGLCSFTLFRASNVSLPPDPMLSSSSTPVPIPPYVAPYLGTWEFDTTTCQTENSSACCCWVGPTLVNIEERTPRYFVVTGPGSSGCRLSSGRVVSDDLPWPTNGTATSSSVQIKSMLSRQHGYYLTFTAEANQAVLFFDNLDNPSCSMRATRIVVSPSVQADDPMKNTGILVGVIFSGLVGCVLIALIGVYLYRRYAYRVLTPQSAW
mmetsp:Transcript_10402/g.16988  ORF Transcript_10402/g.16988 Transcript_10402/m.16988 type:complete len:334 (+) Transcript_10402:150-1151(+)|eukprot:CAMPEP_0184658936 /NCGR_PEP_ID=MMETSP0308-20130426/27401_1 /TAXON_ID=38269 /ORGANISM="Gloeochaete witrockiana, Strain SAG 46.84" /LENGTH=333 /DNA_ID=CAMNT_0027098305 /DNA_START=84 /DNA_END=1085 /DNA_ORIENTATION=-